MNKWFSILCVLMALSFCTVAQNDNVWSGQPLYGRDVIQEMRNINRLEQNLQGFSWDRKWGSFGTGDGQFKSAQRSVVDDQGDIWICDLTNDRVQQFNPDGTFVAKFGVDGTGDGEFKFIRDIDIDSIGHFWVVDSGRQDVQEFDADFNFVSKFSLPSSTNNLSLAINSQDLLYINVTNTQIKVYDTSGIVQDTFGTSGTGSGDFILTVGIAIDKEDNSYIADAGVNRKILKFNSSNTFVLEWNGPTSVVPGQGIVYVSDQQGEWIIITAQSNPRTTDGFVKYTTSGTLVALYGCDIGLNDAQFDTPLGLAFSGNAIRVTLDGDHSAVTNTFQFESGDVSTVLSDANISTPFWLKGDAEQIKVTILNGGLEQVTAVRSENGTTATTHASGTIFQIINVDIFEDLYVSDVANFRIQVYEPSVFTQTEFVKYTTGGTVSLGTPDGGVAVPALDALDSGGAMVAADHIADIRTAIEALTSNYLDPDSCSAFNWTGASSDNLYFVALGDRDTAPSDFGFSSPTPAYDWQRTKVQMDNSPTYDIDIGEVALCIDKLQASNLE